MMEADTPMTAAYPDFTHQYRRIVTGEQRSRYKEDFNSQYNEYRDLHKAIVKVSQRFAQLEEELRQESEGTNAWQVKKNTKNPYRLFRFSYLWSAAHRWPLLSVVCAVFSYRFFIPCRSPPAVHPRRLIIQTMLNSIQVPFNDPTASGHDRSKSCASGTTLGAPIFLFFGGGGIMPTGRWILERNPGTDSIFTSGNGATRNLVDEIRKPVLGLEPRSSFGTH